MDIQEEIKIIRHQSHEQAKMLNELALKHNETAIILQQTSEILKKQSLLIDDIFKRLAELEKENERRKGVQWVINLLTGRFFTIILICLLIISLGIHEHVLKFVHGG